LLSKVSERYVIIFFYNLMVKENNLSINVSGLVSYSILLNPENNKLIILLGDVHDGVEYCGDKQKFWIDHILDKLLDKDNIKVFLEEVPREGLELIELWPNAEHTQRLKDWFILNQNKIIPIDIRPYLVPFSHQKYDMNLLEKDEKEMLMGEYLRTFSSLFKLNGIPLKESIKFFKNIISSLQNKSTQRGILKMYKILRKKYQELLKKINLLETFEKTISSNAQWFRQLEELKLNIMDWYTSLVLMGNYHSVVHFGLAHYLNVRKVLENNFKFKLIHQTGLNSLNNLNSIKACVKFL